MVKTFSRPFSSLFFVGQLLSIAELIEIQPVIVVVTETKPIVVLLLVLSPCTFVAFPSSSSGLGVGVVVGAPPNRCGTSGELELERVKWVGRYAKTDP